MLVFVFLLSACSNKVEFQEGISKNNYKEREYEEKYLFDNASENTSESIEYAKYKLLDFAIFCDTNNIGMNNYTSAHISYLDNVYDNIFTTNISNFEKNKKQVRLHYIDSGEAYLEQQVNASLDLYLTPEMTKNMFR